MVKLMRLESLRVKIMSLDNVLKTYHRFLNRSSFSSENRTVKSRLTLSLFEKIAVPPVTFMDFNASVCTFIIFCYFSLFSYK